MKKILLFLSLLTLLLSTGCINLDVPLVPLIDADSHEKSLLIHENESELAAL